MQLLPIFTLISFAIAFAKCYNILVLMPYDGLSHFFSFTVLFEELAQKGHNLTIISYSQTPFQSGNIRSVWMGRKGMKHSVQLNNTGSRAEFYYAPISLTKRAKAACEYGLQNEAFRSFLGENENTTYDLILAEFFVTECFLGIVTQFKAPVVGLSSCSHISWQADWVGIPSNPSYIQNVFGGFKSPMSFWSRVENTLLLLYVNSWYKLKMEPPARKWSKRFLGSDIADPHNTSLILVNTHYTIDGVRPLTPNVVEVGGIHIDKRQPKKLPEDIDNWINNSDAGVIYFSLGSMIKGDTFPEEQRRAFTRAFAKLPQRVLWKWENEAMPDKPDNVMICKWMPQFDILSHPNVKLFISHGGLLGTIEALHFGVPMLIMPQFGDQRHNALASENNGVGVILHLQSATEEDVDAALRKALDPQMYRNAKAQSEKFRDRPVSPLDIAVYWVEHVARHKGAEHMRSPAIDMPFYQYLLLDVISFLIVVILILIYILYKIIKLILLLVFSLSRSGKMKVS